MSIRQGKNIIAGGFAGPDNSSVVLNSSNQLQTIGTYEKNKNAIKYDWVGTLAEYETQEISKTHPEWVCFITDDSMGADLSNKPVLNNPYSLLDVKWSDKKLNNLSWLLSKGQLNSGVKYKTVYDLLVSEYNTGIDATDVIEGVTVQYKKGGNTGIRIITDESVYNSLLAKTGTAWYYVLNTTNKTFILPQTNAYLQFGGNGNFIPAGLPNITGAAYLGSSSNGSNHVGQWNGAGAFYALPETSAKTAQITGNASDRRSIHFDASRSNPRYGKSDTVQTNAVKGYLYFYVGESVTDAHLIDAGKLSEDLLKLDKTVTYNNVTNCITEIPQDIKLELKDGAIIIHKGSKIYIPDGVGIFREETVLEDIITTASLGDLTFDWLLFAKKDGYGWEIMPHCFSGEGNFPKEGNSIAFNTATGKMQRSINSGDYVDSGESLPIARFKTVGGKITEITQVFNGFGYIGSCFYVLPGVKGLAPNYRNPDGSLKNNEITVKKIILVKNNNKSSFIAKAFLCSIGDGTASHIAWYNITASFEQDTKPQTNSQFAMWFNTSENRFYYKDPQFPMWSPLLDTIEFCTVDVLGNAQAELNVKTVNTLKLLDHTDKALISGWGMPSHKWINLTLGPSGTQYIAPANGYWYINKESKNAQYEYINMNTVGAAFRSETMSTFIGQQLPLWHPSKKGDVMSLNYNATGKLWEFQFYYTEGN